MTAAVQQPDARVRAYQQIQIAAILESPLNPRKQYGALEELENSIRQVGILQPLIVREVDGKWEIVFGHRRFRAAKNLGLALIPCEVRQLSDLEVLEAQIVENVQRENLTWLEEGEAYAKLQEVGAYSAAQIAEKVGKSVGWVYGRLKLTALGPEARKAFGDGRLQGSVALALARVPAQLQGKAVLLVAPKSGEAPTARRAIELLQRDFCRQLRRAPFDVKDDMLVPEAGSCLKCPKNSRTTPDLFGDFDRGDVAGAGVCADPICYAAKVAADVKTKTAALVKEGAKETKEPRFFVDGGLEANQPWVKLDDPMGQDPKRRTWRQLLEKLAPEQRPQLYVAQAGEHGVAQVLKRADAMAGAAELGHAFAKAEVKQEAREAKERQKATESRGEKKVRLEIVAEVGERVAAEVGARGVTVRELRWLARAYLETRNVERVLERRELTEPELEKWIDGKADVKELGGFLLECVADQFGAACAEGYPEEFLDMAKTYRLDVERLEQLRAQRKEEKKVAREEKKKAKGAA